MELIPYDVEYVRGHKSKEEVEMDKQHTVEELKQMLFENGRVYNDVLDEDTRSDDVNEELEPQAENSNSQDGDRR